MCSAGFLNIKNHQFELIVMKSFKKAKGLQVWEPITHKKNGAKFGFLWVLFPVAVPY